MSNDGAGQGYLISRNTKDDAYGVWQFDPAARTPFTRVKLKRGASFDRRNTLVWIGGYLLSWGPERQSQGSPYYEFALIPFDPTSDDPLGAPPLQHGQWTKQKFWGRLPDFGNPTGGKKQFDVSEALTLIPLGSFLLNFIPTAGRGTYALWNFDPSPLTPGAADPIPGPFSYTYMSSFRNMQLGDQLIPLDGYVLDRNRATGEYQLWSFDSQNVIPISHPAIQSGRWKSIGPRHELVTIGDHVLDWVPGEREYRVWKFDPTQSDPLVGPVRTGVLPRGFDRNSTLVGFQPSIPVDTKRAASPATVDFMRSKIKHVVYYMLENRSFDHVVGWLYERGEKGVRVIGPEGPYKGASTKYFNYNADGNKVHLSKVHGGKLSTDYELEIFTFDPYHDNTDVLRQYFYKEGDGYEQRATPNMGGFVWNNGSDQVMQTYTPEQLPVLNGLAREFAISDEWFASLPSSTDANRAFAVSGSAQMQLNNWMTPPQYLYWPQQPHRPSIWKLLWANGITDWTIYNSTQWQNHVFSYELFLEGQIPAVDADVAASGNHYVAPITQFYSQAAAGTLPAFSYLEPVWIGVGGTTSYHPGADLIPGEIQLNKVYDALRKGPNWENTLLFITFDEHGGIFDHVPPPYAVNPWPNDVNDGFRYDLLGPRVPTIVVSPWIDRQTVFRSDTGTAYDATSFLATLLNWFGVPKAQWWLGDRIKGAPSFEGLLTRGTPRAQSPEFQPPYDIDFPPTGEPTPPTRLHDLHLHIAHQIVASMARGKLPPNEINALMAEVLHNSTDIEALTRQLNALQKRFD